MKIDKMLSKRIRGGIVSLAIMTIVGTTGGTLIKAANQIEAEAYCEQEESSNQGDTLYGIGSVSKVFTTVAVMQLVDSKKLALDESITTYLPEFQMMDERYKQITVRMLLNHSSGLMGSTFSNNMLYEDNDTIAHDKLLEKLGSQRLKAEPGLYGTYCNDGFIIAELLVERVSGESFTDYLQAHIFVPLGMKESGTPINRMNKEAQAVTYLGESTIYATDYCNAIGTGGILSTAEEVCKFGQTFMKEHNSLLSDKAIKEMNTPAFEKGSYGYVAEGSWENYGLGWDSVDAYPFNKYGIKTLIKGGDLENQHSILMVLPEENVSVSVLSSGGSSTFNGLLAEELAKIALEEKGSLLEEKIEEPKVMIVDQVPEKYLSYEGNYANNKNIYHLSFPEGEYLQVESCDKEIQKVQTYHYTKEGYFISDDAQYISSTGEMCLPSNRQHGKTVLSFETKNDGKQYLCMDTVLTYAEIGNAKLSGMFAEKLEENPVEADTLKAWKMRDGKKYYLTSEKYSSTIWHMAPVIKLDLSSQQEGYINGYGSMSVAKITSHDKAKAFVTLSGSMGRDLSDISIIKQGEREQLYLEDTHLYYIDEASIQDLDLSKNTIRMTEQKAHWFNIGSDTEKRKVTIKADAKMAVYIYDEYDECIYSTYMKNCGDQVILPVKGKIAVIGEKGSCLEIEEY